MEDEARDILRNVLSAEAVESPQLGSAIHALFAPLAGVDLPAIERGPMREPPGFEA
jgi:plasmid stability protein